MHSADTDLELVRRMGASEDQALGILYDRWATLVHSLVIRLLEDAGEAEEVVEETFWQAWRQAPRYDLSRGSVSTWLVTIARSRALDRARARKRRKEESLTHLHESDAATVTGVWADASNPHEDAEAADRRGAVIRALGTLPEEQREALHLAYFSGLSQTEIAVKTGQPLGTVKTRTRLAMEKMRAQLPMLRETG
ncbi:MAG: sigma-70 family RNA polymerase sigma factor [Gemmatimonadaceae bacterium]